MAGTAPTCFHFTRTLDAGRSRQRLGRPDCRGTLIERNSVPFDHACDGTLHLGTVVQHRHDELLEVLCLCRSLVPMEIEVQLHGWTVHADAVQRQDELRRPSDGPAPKLLDAGEHIGGPAQQYAVNLLVLAPRVRGGTSDNVGCVAFQEREPLLKHGRRLTCACGKVALPPMSICGSLLPNLAEQLGVRGIE